MPLSKIEEIRKLLEACDQEEISKLRTMVDDAGSLIRMVDLQAGKIKAENMRQEKRIPYDSAAKVKRLTGVKPNEKTEFEAELKDVSKSGLCLIIEGRFIPSRLIKVNFETPVGKNKEVVLEVVRVKDNLCKKDDVLKTEVGCKAIGHKEANKIIKRDHKVTALREKLQKRERVFVLIVSDSFSDIDEKVYQRLRRDGYNVRKCFSLHQALASAERTQAQLLVLCKGTKLRYDPDFTKGFRHRSKTLASIAVVDNEKDRRHLSRAGVDECITPESIDYYINEVLEAAIIGHELRAEQAVNNKKILLVGGDNLTRNSIKDMMDVYRYETIYCDCSDKSEQYGIEEFELVFAYYDSENPLEFMRVLELYYSNTVIAICETPLDGRDAIVRGAADYICAPVDDDSLTAILSMENGKAIK